MLKSGGTFARKRMLEEDPEEEQESPRRVKREVGSSGGTGNSRQHGIPPGESESPLERPLPFKHVTFTFTQRSWEEIDNDLWTLPLTIGLMSMLDSEMLAVIQKIMPCCLGYRLHKPQVRLTNFIILTDELQVKANTPLEMASFVQQSKIIHFTPKHQSTTGYTISNVTSTPFYKWSELMKTDRANFLYRLPYSNNFETLKLYEISSPIHGNLENRNVRYQGYVLNDTDYTTFELLASPSTEEDRVWLRTQNAFGVVDQTTQVKNITHNWTLDPMTISTCRNRDKIEILGAGDTVAFDVETNVEGDLLYPDHITETGMPTPFTFFSVKGTEKVNQMTLWKYGFVPWPSTFNPKTYRRNASLGSQWLHAQYKPLQHHFFTMVPIKKANGNLIKQRASLMLEQSVQISFVFRDDETDGMAPLDMAHLRARGGWAIGLEGFDKTSGTKLPFLT